MRYFLILPLLLTVLFCDAQEPVESSSAAVTAKLLIPFGTIAKLEAEVYDGNLLHRKGYEGIYLLKIISVNDRKINDTLLLTFIDETEKFATDDVELYKMTFGKTTHSITDAQKNDMKKNYVGTKLTLMAYETGRFTGMPNDYFKYRPVSGDKSFHFHNYLIIVSNLTK